MKYRRMPIEEESPEQLGYDKIRFNLTESSVRDRSLADLGIEVGDMVLFYGDHLGNDTFRELIAAQSGGAGGGVGRDDVLVTAGAAQALFIIATSLLDKGDHLVVIRPNYATNIETPRAIEADVSYLDLTFEEGFRIDPDKLMALVTPRTKYVSITLPHNPTGVTMSEADLRSVVGRVEAAGCRLLVDETYREMTFGDPLPVAATLSDRAISVSSLSKTYGIPGIRSGWLVCRDRELMATFLAAKEQIGICGSVVDEEIAARAFAQRDTWLPEINAFIRRRFDVVSTLDGRRGAAWSGWSRAAAACASRASSRTCRWTSTSSTARSTTGTAPTWARATGSSSRGATCVSATRWPLPDELEGGLAADLLVGARGPDHVRRDRGGRHRAGPCACVGAVRGADGLLLTRQAWRPEGAPAAVLAVVHGYGEHGGRYRGLAEDMAARGYARARVRPARSRPLGRPPRAPRALHATTSTTRPCSSRPCARSSRDGRSFCSATASAGSSPRPTSRTGRRTALPVSSSRRRSCASACRSRRSSSAPRGCSRSSPRP